MKIGSSPKSSTMPDNLFNRSRYRTSRGRMSTSNILSSTSTLRPIVKTRSFTHPAASPSSSGPYQDLSPGVKAELPGYMEPVELSSTHDHAELSNSRRWSANRNVTQNTNIPPTFAYTNTGEPTASPTLQPLAQRLRPVEQEAIRGDQERDQGLSHSSGSRNYVQLRPCSNSCHVERDSPPAELPTCSTSYPNPNPPIPIAQRRTTSLKIQETSAMPLQSMTSSRSTWCAEPNGRRWASRNITSQNSEPYSDVHRANTATKRLSRELGHERNTVFTRSPLSLLKNLQRSGSGSYRGDGSDDEDTSQLGGGSVCGPRSYW
jgi:hypothetical protein